MSTGQAQRESWRAAPPATEPTASQGSVQSPRRRTVAACALIFMAGATVDFTSLNPFRSLQLADLLIVAAGVLLAAGREVQRWRALLREHLVLRVICGLLLAYVVGSGVALLIAGVPADGLDTWALFAVLLLGVAPATAVIVVSLGTLALRWLTRGIYVAFVIAVLGLAAKMLITDVPTGYRISGLLDSDPYFVLIAGQAIVVTRLTAGLGDVGFAAAARSPLVWAEAALFGASIWVLLLTEYRSGWGAALIAVALGVYLVSSRFLLAYFWSTCLAGTLVLAYRLGYLPDRVTTRIQQTATTDAPDYEARGTVIELLLPVWQDQPWGIGWGQSREYLTNALIEGKTGAIHNIVLNALVEGGPLAALAIAVLPLAVTWLWYRGAQVSFRHPQPWLAVWPIAAMWPMFAAGQLTPTLYPHVAWITIGAAVGVGLAFRREDVLQWSRRPAPAPSRRPVLPGQDPDADARASRLQ